jgi:predicted nuclease of predicted toxin-antitoxin system
VKVFLDQGVPYSTTQYLTDAGWEVLHAVDLEMERATDRAIITYARDNDSCCITLDADFHSIIAVDNAEKPSVIRIRHEGLKGKDVAELLIRIWPDIESALESGALVTVTDRSVRVRYLPIQQ